MIAIDTNLLIYAHRKGLPEHQRAIQIIEQLSDAKGGWGIPLPCFAEFWSVVTRPDAWSRPSTPSEAKTFFSNLVRDGAAVLEPKAGAGDRLLSLAADLALTGRRIFDLQIAFAALEAGAQEIWTNDRDFVSIPGLSVRHPL